MLTGGEDAGTRPESGRRRTARRPARPSCGGGSSVGFQRRGAAERVGLDERVILVASISTVRTRGGESSGGVRLDRRGRCGGLQAAAAVQGEVLGATRVRGGGVGALNRHTSPHLPRLARQGKAWRRRRRCRAAPGAGPRWAPVARLGRSGSVWAHGPGLKR
jgi:hypothetical protein